VWAEADLRYEFRAVVAPDVHGRTADRRQRIQHLHDIDSPERPLDLDGQALARVLVEHHEHLQAPPATVVSWVKSRPLTWCFMVALRRKMPPSELPIRLRFLRVPSRAECHPCARYGVSPM
jgi:hypothetical protein